ncbi:MAG: DEAD/DEAH box helicase [Clostridia bacterium]|nr:DEAD/DEAH box helicase [Clostridia bacterium]
MILRNYQQFLIYKIKCEINNGKRAICCVLGCGGGKSVIQGNIAASANAKGNRVLFLVHRKELCEQIRDTFSKCGVDWNLTQVMMVQTATRHIRELHEPDIIITDECHLSTAKTYTKIYDTFKNALRLGFTATPCRLNEGGLGNVYDSLVEGVSTKWLIQNKFLADYKYYSLPLADTDNLHVKCGEFVSDEVNALIENQAVYSGAVEQYLKLANGQKAMVYCPSVVSSKEVAEQFNAAGVPAAHVDGTTPKSEREELVAAYRSGKLMVLTNVELFGVGFDDKDIICTIFLRPTMSVALYIQMAMRSLRYKEGKTAIILDCVGNARRHGLPPDDRKWTLESKKKQQNMVKIRECESCFAVYEPTHSVCPYCGFKATKEIQRKEKKSVTVDLVEIQKQEELKNVNYNEYQKFTTFEQLAEFQKARGYRIQWTIRKCDELGIKVPGKYSYMRRYMK